MKEENYDAEGRFRNGDDLSPESARQEPSVANGARSRPYRNGYAANGHQTSSREIDVWSIVDLFLARWPWVIIGSFACAGLFLLLGMYVVKPKYTANAQLLRYETPGATEFFPPISGETFSALIRSPELLQKVGEQAFPPVPAGQLTRQIRVDPDPDSDVVKLSLAANHPRQAFELLNLYASNAVEYVRAWYGKRAEVVSANYLKEQVAHLDRDIKALEEQLMTLGGVSPQVTNQFAQVSGALATLGHNLTTAAPSSPVVARQRERLNTALLELDDLMIKYTDIHPSVVAKRQQVENLQKQLAAASTNQTSSSAIASSPPIPRAAGDIFNPEMDIVRTKLLAVQDGRVTLANRQREAQLYAENPPGTVRLFAPATMQTVQGNKRRVKIGLMAIFGGGFGLLASLALIGLLEFTDNRLKTADDLKRVTNLPILTSLGDLRGMTPHDRSQWAFRTWTMLQGRLSPSANHGLVCGITSSAAGEGRSTWIHLLAEAASLTGFRVLTIATRPSPTYLEVDEEEEEIKQLAGEAESEMNGSGGDVKNNNGQQSSAAITPSVLSSPSQVTEKLTGPNSQPVVHIPLPGWVWNLERRKQWGDALNQWRKIDNLVILVELPPACVPEAVLLGSNLPNLVWLMQGGKAQAGETRTQLETLRHARCNIVGAVLNREWCTPVRKLFPRWLGVVAVSCGLGLGSGSGAELSTNSSPAESIESSAAKSPGAPAYNFSVVRPTQRGAWQQRLTLGPGDVLNLALFGQPELARTEIAVGPDGRISYLEAQDVLATGKTVDELRLAIDKELGNFRRGPRSMITPVAFRSKKYYMLGKVMTKGVFTLDRPLTVLEAIARAHGFENGLIDRNVVDLADFQHSFLMRGGKRFGLNFDKLFQEGDLTQNLGIEPDDYIYIAPAEVQDVYVLGEVRLPGTVTYNSQSTIISAIASRGGFTERAFRARVLVVRGPLNHPQTFAVDTHAITDGQLLNFKLLPKDIIYVNSRPFIRVEELADLAATAFIQSIVTEWVGVDVVKPIQ